MHSCFWRRGWRSQRADIDVVVGESSARPYVMVLSPDTTCSTLETAGG